MEPIRTKENIDDLKAQYYADNTKVSFFGKTQQKFDCAETICSQIPMDQLLQKMAHNIKNTNHLYFSYSVFKLFAHPNNYIEIVDYMLALCNHIVKQNGSFEMHLDFAGFTISGAERYKNIITFFCDVCLQRNTEYTEYMVAMNIYNTPTIMDSISRMLLPLIPVYVRPKIKLYSKKDSAEKLAWIGK